MSPIPTGPNHSDPAQPLYAAQASQLPVRVILEQPQRRYGRLGRRLLWVLLGLSILMNISLFGTVRNYFKPGSEVHEKYHSLERTAMDKVAIISVEGTIMGGDGFVKKQIDQVRDDPHVKAIVLRVNSPGGTVTGSDYIYHHLKELVHEREIPLVVSMGSIAASGGYYVAMAAGDKEKIIFAEPTTWTGSIGVIIPHYDLSGLLEKWNVADDSISSHAMKQMGSPTRQLTKKEREKEHELLKELVDESFAGFKDIVLKSRAPLRKDKKLQDTVFTGRIFTAGQAKRMGLVDELGFVEDAIDRAIQLAGLDKDQVRVVKYTGSNNLLASLMFGGEDEGKSFGKGFDLQSLLDLTVPRAFYLCTSLPSLSGSAN